MRISDLSADVCASDLFPIRAGTDGASNSAPLTAAEVRALLEEAFAVMSRARAQIRRPLASRAQVSLSIVDTNGAVLGLVRAPDAPLFGTDGSLPTARTATFFSDPKRIGVGKRVAARVGPGGPPNLN